jgi:large subunit ribosomal protein L21
MSNYAVIQLAGKQYRVQEGDTLTVNRLEQEEGKTFTTNEVLLTVADGAATIGAPFVSGAQVKLEVVKNQKGEKIRVATYKAKSRYPTRNRA